MKKGLALAPMIWLAPSVAYANLSRAALESVAIHLPPTPRLDMSLAARDTSGTVRRLGDIAGGRTLFVNFVDYTCNTLCGTDLMLLADGIRRAGLRPAEFQIVVIGLDPRDGAAAAVKMKDAEIPPNLQVVSTFLLPNARAVAKATAALGFHYVYDPQIDQFAHPAAVYAVAPDGTVRALLSPLALTAGDLRAALQAAHPLSLYDRIHALCYGFNPATGLYTLRISILLKAAAVATMLLMAGAIALLSRKGQRP